MIKEGTVPVLPPSFPFAERDSDVFPVQEISQFGSRSGGGETPVNHQVLKKIFLQGRVR
jgi:hypothetical protein